MDKIKKMSEFKNILEYFYYLKDALDDFNNKKNSAVSNDSRNFYQEQIDIIMKQRSAIREVVLAQKERLVHKKLNDISTEQVHSFTKSKKAEKEKLSKQKLDLELEIALYNSVADFDKNVFAPIAKSANEYDCADFFVSSENYEKSYLIRNSNNKLEECSVRNILAQYLSDNTKILDKIEKRHEIKESFMAKYIEDLKHKYPNYSEKQINSLAQDNLISHSPEFLVKIDKECGFTDSEYEALAKCYAEFKTDYMYLENFDLDKKQALLEEITNDFKTISKIPQEKELESYLLNKFRDYEEKTHLVKTASEILENDNNIIKYMTKNNLLKDIKLSPETKQNYTSKLVAQRNLLVKIKDVETEIQELAMAVNKQEKVLDTLKHSKSALGEIYTTEDIINNVNDIVNNYTENFVKPLENAKAEYEKYKNTQELGLIPYEKPSFLDKLVGFFNGRNKLQNEFNNKCQEYDSRIYLLNQKAIMNKPNYSFDDKQPLAQSIGKDIKEYFSNNPNATDKDACAEVLQKYRDSLKSDISGFKEKYKDCIYDLENCSSYEEISDCILDEVTKIQKQIDAQKQTSLSMMAKKDTLCAEYNENAKRPIATVATFEHLTKIDNEYKLQIEKISDYKGENIETLKYKIAVEKALEKDNSFISEQEMHELGSTAEKKAETILNNAINSYEVEDDVVKSIEDVNCEKKNKTLVSAEMIL